MKKFERPQRIPEQIWIDEKNSHIKYPIDIFKWHIGILNDKQSLMREVSEKEETIRKQAVLIKSQNELLNKFGMHQTYYKKPYGKKKDQRNYNKFKCNNSYTSSQKKNTHTGRSRSKSENNQDIDSMDFWEWNGTQWINCNPNRVEEKIKENTEVQSKSTDSITKSDAADLTTETSADQSVSSTYIPLQDNEGSNFNNDPQIVNESNVPSMSYIGKNGLIDCSISFEEHEIRNLWKHSRPDDDMLPKAKRPKISEQN